MQFSSALAVILGLAGATNAVDVDSAYVGDFSMWNGGQCGAAPGNPIGMWSINKTLIESCYDFKNFDEQSLRFLHLNAPGEEYTRELAPIAVTRLAISRTTFYP